MVSELRHILEQAEHLTPERQQVLAQRIRSLIAELEQDEQWDRTFASSEGQARLAELVARADYEIANGEVEEGGFAL
jgi:hypothetical protein